MIAIRRLLFRGWGADPGMRVHVVQPSPIKPPAGRAKTIASRAAAARRRADAAERQRRQIETLWITHGGR